MDRREFLRLTGSAATVAGLGWSCGSGSDKPKTTAATRESGSGGAAPKELRIATWSHFVPAYDTWLDNEFTKRWGDEHDVNVVVDHLPLNELPIRGDSEAAAKRGHDLFWFINPRAALEDEVIDHREIVEEVAGKVGKLVPHVERSVSNPRTGAFFAFPDHWSAGPAHYRVDLWDGVQPGLRPSTWDDVRRAGATLKARGHPLGLGISTDVDSSWTLNTLLHCYGAAIQDENANLTINTPATIEAVKVCSEIYRTGMTDEIFAWDASSNNRVLTSGRGSLILNAVSAVRAAEQQDPELASKIALAPAPIGSAGDRPRSTEALGSYVIWKFSPNIELAKQFLVDLSLGYRDAFLQSGFFNLPAFPGAVPDLAELVAKDPVARPQNKYALLGNAVDWSTNVGNPGYFNAAIDEVFNVFILSKMFSAAARGEKSPADAVAAAEAEMRPIFAKWRERGKI
ncbi:MAG TPA: ABC transporter substrate-binding protein [Acidimicrobiia bacterium]|jgi:multiple sugar transport system substrate-binding protein|nr:ABC transporter substrate-binding protein [Acidimicrobiia bacterium]